VARNFFERSAVLQNSGFTLIDIVDLAYYDGFMSQVDGVFLRCDLLPIIKRKQPFDYASWQSFK
jgi:hypothetical protein